VKIFVERNEKAFLNISQFIEHSVAEIIYWSAAEAFDIDRKYFEWLGL
jgi:hypothetical protein